MKARYIFTAMLATALMFGMTACSDDDDEYDPGLNVPAAQEKSSITIDTEGEVQVGVGETSTFNITGGGGDYKVVAENPAYVEAAVSGNTVTLSGVEKGIAGVLISDAQGNYKHVTVKSMYFQMTLDKTEVLVGMKLGHTDGVAKVTVIGGNGNYTAESADLNVAKTSVKDNVITIQGVKKGETTVTIKDMMGLTQTVNVKVEPTTIPFTEDEKAEVLALTKNIQTFDGLFATYLQWYSGSYFVEAIDGGYKLYSHYGSAGGGYSYYAMVFTFKGDLSVGKKTEGAYSNTGWDGTTTYDGLDVEILKNDGSRIWGIISGVKDDYLHTGYFCMPL